MENEFISYTFHHWNEFEAVWPNNKNLISKENISFEVSDCGCMCSCKPFTCVHLFTAPYLCIRGFFFFQKNLVTLICCYSLLSGGLNKWLLHLNAGKMRNKPDYTNQKPRYHSWLQRYSLGNWLVQGPRECLNDSKWNTLIGLFVDNLVAHDDTQRHVTCTYYGKYWICTSCFFWGEWVKDLLFGFL